MSLIRGSTWCDCPGGLGDAETVLDEITGGGEGKSKQALKRLLARIEDARDELEDVAAEAKKQKQALKRLGAAGSSAAPARRSGFNWPLFVGLGGLGGLGYYLVKKNRRRRSRR